MYNSNSLAPLNPSCMCDLCRSLRFMREKSRFYSWLEHKTWTYEKILILKLKKLIAGSKILKFCRMYKETSMFDLQKCDIFKLFSRKFFLLGTEENRGIPKIKVIHRGIIMTLKSFFLPQAMPFFTAHAQSLWGRILWPNWHVIFWLKTDYDIPSFQ